MAAVRTVAWRLAVEGDQIAVQKLTGVGTAAHKAIEPIPGLMRGVSAATSELQDHLTGLGGRLGAVGNVLQAMGPIGLGIAATLGAVGLAAHEAFSRTREADQFADGIEKAAKQLRLGTDAYQEFSAAAKTFNIDQGEINAGFDALRTHVSEFIAGVGGQKGIGQVFKDLGLSREQLAGAGSLERQINLIADALSRIKNVDVREGLADRLGLASLLPMLQGGSVALGKLKEDARQTGQVMDEALVKTGADANREYEKLATTIDVRMKSAFVGLSPLMLRWQEMWADIAKSAANFVQSLQKAPGQTTDFLRERMRTDQEKLDQMDAGLKDMRSRGASNLALNDAQQRRDLVKADMDEAWKEFQKRVVEYPIPKASPGALPPSREDDAAAAARAKMELDEAEQSLNKAVTLSEQRRAFLAQIGIETQRSESERINAENAANVESLRGKEGYYKALLKQANDAADAEIAVIDAEVAKQLTALDKLRSDYAANGQVLAGYDTTRAGILAGGDNQKGAVNARRGQDVYAIAKESQGAIKDLVDQINGPLDLSLKQIGADGLHSFTDALVGIGTGAEDAGKAVGQMVDSILSDLLRLEIEREVTKPLGNLLDSFISSYTGGGHADGGSVGLFSRVNERGGFPEAMMTPGGDVSILSSPTSLKTVVDAVRRSGGGGGGTTVIAASAPRIVINNNGAPVEVEHESFDAASNTSRVDIKSSLRDANVGSTRRGDFDRALDDRYGVRPLPRRRN